jgi:uncharacterized protein
MSDASVTRATVEAFLAELEAGDVGAAVGRLAEPVDWRVPGSSAVPWIGERSTRAEATEFFALLDRHLEAERFVVTRILVDGADAVVLGDFRDTVRATGATLESWFAIHLTVADGQITRYHFYEDSYAVARAMGAM